MLTRLDQLPHQVFQLIVSLDQIAEVRIQHVLKNNNNNNNKARRLSKQHLIMRTPAEELKRLTSIMMFEEADGFCSSVQRTDFTDWCLYQTSCDRPHGPPALNPQRREEGRGIKRLTRIWNYKSRLSPSAAYVPITNAAFLNIFKQRFITIRYNNVECCTCLLL